MILPLARSLSLLSCVALCGGFVLAASAVHAADGATKSWWVYFGTYTKTDQEGIPRTTWDPISGRLGEIELAGVAKNPSFLALHPTHRFLYCCSETASSGGKKSGAVNAFAIEPRTGKLKLLNQESSGGAGPCHVAVDAAGKNVLAANYGSGSIACLPIAADGHLGPPSCTIQQQGTGPNAKRQTGPHAHCINLDPTGRFAMVADLGADQVFVYRFDPAAGMLTANDPPSVHLPPGVGPRHVAFHPNGRFVYLINEMACTVTTLAYDATKGTLTAIDSVATLPSDLATDPARIGNTTAEVVVHPSGKFLYGSNRGHDSIAIFAIDPASGKPRLLGHESTQGKMPRFFTLDPSGNYLLCANQAGNNVVVFHVDAQTGLLRPTGQSVHMSSPVCIVFMPPLE